MSKTPEELTEDWKKGKLEYGRYWVKNKVWEEPFIDRWLPNYSWEISCKKAIEQVLAPVPTYEEYKAMQEQLNKEGVWYTKISYKKLEKENDSLIETPEEFKYIDHEYCNQWMDGGCTGDSYAGELYFPLPNGKYLECHYEC